MFPTSFYNDSLALLTDLYQLTMAYGYWKLGKADRRAVFHLYFRHNPFDSGFTMAAGLAYVVDYLGRFAFAEADVAYLATLRGNDGKPLFEPGFLDYLRELKLTCDIDAIAEGTVVFPNEPLVRVTGPLLQCQLLETPLLNLINFQTLIATKAARICMAARGDAVLEFGLRRAQGIDGGVTASRGAYIGGCAGTSNVLAGKWFDIPIKGTHAHSWVMSFDNELESFEAYARVMPNNCVFLVDTYNTIEGVRHAAQVGKMLQRHGHKLAGIRLDSGDLAYLSIEARKILDEAGLTDAAILASNDLNETLINSLKDQGATINVWGVGTHLATAYEQPALGGIYKLAALEDEHGRWQYKVKLSEQTAKTSTPGVLQVRRFHDGQYFIADAIYNTVTGLPPECIIVDPADFTRRKTIPSGTPGEDLLMPIFRGGQCVHTPPDVHAARAHGQEQLGRLHPTIRRQINPHRYPAGLERSLHDMKLHLILQARGVTP